jgi:hypothetical protein
MKQYHKIQTVFLRDPATKYKTLLIWEWAKPEFKYLKDCPWVFTEKVDGTNIRIMFNGELSFGGKTNNAQIPPKLFDALVRLFSIGTLLECFPDAESGVVDVCLYGEGYGAKIQKGGGKYRQDQGFVLFDVRVGNLWLQRKDVEDVAAKLGIDVVPIIGEGTLDDMVFFVEAGFSSRWGDFQAEGIVARPAIELCTRNGERIITKIKYRDFGYSTGKEDNTGSETSGEA